MAIECSFGVVNWLPGSPYICEVKSASITKPDTRMKPFKGLHEAGKSNADVEGFWCCIRAVHYFPLGLNKIFPNLKYLRIIGCGLKEISRRDLIGLESLTGLWLSGNQLKYLPDNLLTRMTKLTTVDFSHNPLDFASSKLLQPIMNNQMIKVDFHSIRTSIGTFEPGHSHHSIGSLQELCKIIDTKFKKPTSRDVPVHSDSCVRFLRGFEELWTPGIPSDFVIECESKEFHVRRKILMCQSSVLAAAVRCDMRESKTGRMVIEDFSKEAVEDFLKYLYTGEKPEDTNAMELFALASKYDVPWLKRIMEDIILTNLDETNAFEILVLSKQHDCESLAQDAFTEIQGIFHEIELDPSLVGNLERLKQLIAEEREYEDFLQSGPQIEI